MNAPTEKERALANLRHLYQQMAGGQVKDSAQAKRIADGLLSPAIAKLEKAARRAPAAPVPQGWKHVPVQPTDNMRAAALETPVDPIYNGNVDYCVNGEEIYAAMLAAAPQPPAASPVQLPEPAATVLSKLGTTCIFKSAEISKGTNLYTEQQVRELLAKQGIK